MHTHRLKPEMFEVMRPDVRGGMEIVFPDWDRHDRLGIVIHEPWGAIGASLLLQGAVAEFFRARRAAGIKDIYPELYAFHVGRDFGNLSMFDVHPYHKEVVVESSPEKVLQAINDRAITRLAVPVGEARPYDFMFPERISVYDRVRTVVGYHPTGVTAGGDISIRATSAEVEDNTVATLDLLKVQEPLVHTDERDMRRWLGITNTRISAVTPLETQQAINLHQANVRDGLATESYLATDLDYALARLVP